MIEQRGFSRNLLSASAYAVAAAACYAAFVLFQPGQQIDAAALGANFLDMPQEFQLEVFGHLRSGSVVVLGVLTVVFGCVRLVRRQWRLVAVTFVCSVVAAGGATLLRRVLWIPELGVESYDYNTWPSGHVAAVCVLALVCLRLMPPVKLWRWAAAVAVVVVAAAAYASVASFAHRPSDTLGGILIAGAVFALSRPGWAASYRLRWGWMVVLAAAAAAAVLLVFPEALSAENPRAALALGSLCAMFATSCWVLLPERPANDYERYSRSSHAASS